MGIQINALKCTSCMACEMVCSYHRDDGFAFLSACIVPYRAKEKKDYLGVLLKQEDALVVARPEGVEVNKIGEEADPDKKGDASAKPMLLREGCDLCEDMDDYGPMCVVFCPVDAITLDE